MMSLGYSLKEYGKHFYIRKNMILLKYLKHISENDFIKLSVTQQIQSR